MRIALVDDEQEELDRLSGIIARQLALAGYFKNQIDCFPNGETFLTNLTYGRFDLIILDIFMDNLSGIDVARRIRQTDKEVRLVFCTSSNSFASESYEVCANYYLRKPYSEKNISDMFQRLNMEEYELRRSVFLPDGQNIILRNILYTEYTNHIVTIYNKKGENIRTRITQTEFERLLMEYPYFCITSKGVIVNFYEVVEQNENVFLLSNGCTVPISRRKKKEVLEIYTNFRFERLRNEVTE
ncbi:MAG: response regulator transcription factor [Lachnospiraceae bacterium]|nr:response regulator transcription factor [Lachnospiraceae bacterium]